MNLPRELIEQIERGNVLLFIGERTLRNAEDQPMFDWLTNQLKIRSGIAESETYTFSEAAQGHEDNKGRQALVQFVRDQIDMLGNKPQPIHNLIAKLTACNLFATTCIDQLLEHAFANARRPLNTIIGSVDIAFEDEHKAQLYKLRGSVERPESLVLTEDDYETFFENQTSLSVVFQGYLARKTVLFIGYDLTDPHFKRMYRKVTTPFDDYTRRSYAIGDELTPKVARWCKRHNIDVIESDVRVFLETLTKQLSVRPLSIPHTSIQTVEEPVESLPERPYKLLDYYEAKDASIFFGRQRSIPNPFAPIIPYPPPSSPGNYGSGCSVRRKLRTGIDRLLIR
jgi:hypothetical protein